MSTDEINVIDSDGLISVPSFLSDGSEYSTLSTRSINCSNQCQSCMISGEACGNSQSECNYCQGLSCEGSGQGPCSTNCQTNICQTSCESICNTTCQGCQSSCQHTCESCQSQCEIYNETPSLWSWTFSNGSASNYQTQLAYDAISNRGEVSNFSYLVWNDLVTKVYDAIQSDGGSWDSKYALYSTTKMNSSDKTLTATRFNSLRYNVEIHESTGLNDVFAGDKVYGWYFTTITNSLNNYISTL